MKLLFEAAGPGDVVVHVGNELPAGEVTRDGSSLRVGTLDEAWGLDGLRASAAAAARSVRKTGGRIAWSARSAEEARAIVDGTAYGAYDPGIRKRGYGDAPELTLVLDADGDARAAA